MMQKIIDKLQLAWRRFWFERTLHEKALFVFLGVMMFFWGMWTVTHNVQNRITRMDKIVEDLSIKYSKLLDNDSSPLKQYQYLTFALSSLEKELAQDVEPVEVQSYLNTMVKKYAEKKPNPTVTETEREAISENIKGVEFELRGTFGSMNNLSELLEKILQSKGKPTIARIKLTKTPNGQLQGLFRVKSFHKL